MGMFPDDLAGRTIDCVFDRLTPRLTFGGDGLRVQLKGRDFTIDEIVPATVERIRHKVFAVSWTERGGNFVVQVQDYEQGRVLNFARLAGGGQFCATGDLRPVAA